MKYIHLIVLINYKKSVGIVDVEVDHVGDDSTIEIDITDPIVNGRGRRSQSLKAPVGTADPVVAVVLNTTKEINYIASIGIARGRRFSPVGTVVKVIVVAADVTRGENYIRATTDPRDRRKK